MSWAQVCKGTQQAESKSNDRSPQTPAVAATKLSAKSAAFIPAAVTKLSAESAAFIPAMKSSLKTTYLANFHASSGQLN